MRAVAPLLALLVSAPAYAGGVGPMVMGGFHTESVPYYWTIADAGQGDPIADINAYEQVFETQFIGNVGGGLELVLGDRDDLIQGVFRGYYMMDFAQSAPGPGAELLDSGAVIANWRENVNHLGIGSVGLTFGVARAAADRFKFSIATHIGAAFVTENRGEFILWQVGGNANYLITRTVEFYVEVTYGLRARKDISHGVYGAAGLRFMFD